MAIFNMIGGGGSSIDGFELELWDSGTYTSTSTSRTSFSIVHNAPVYNVDDFENQQMYLMIIERTSGTSGSYRLQSAKIVFTRYPTDSAGTVYSVGQWRDFDTMGGTKHYTDYERTVLSIEKTTTKSGSYRNYVTTFTIGPFVDTGYASSVTIYGTYKWSIYKVK